MLSPDSFTRTHRRHVTDVVRVALERRGMIGFIETHEGMTLLEARQLIWENVENAPCDFQFVLDDGVPVSARQESTQRVLQFYPCIKIRECKKPTSPVSRQSATSPSSLGITEGTAPRSNSSTEKISVWTASGDEFTAWISEEYTFQQLRRDAARYWNLPAGQVVLTDRDGCLWPEQAKILAVMGVDELLERKIVLESKAGGTDFSGNPKARSVSSLARTMAVAPTRRRSSMDSSASPLRTSTNWQDVLMGSAPPDESTNPVEELWRVFTYYCVNGDSLDLECIRAHQFNRLLRDAQVLGAAVTPAMADIIYTSETKGKPQASGKMNFDEFLNALVKIALARHRKSSNKLLQRSVDTAEEDELFQRLVGECILPRAARWPTHSWELQTQQLRTPEMVGFISKFLDPLLDIYAFYAKSHLLNASSGVKEFHMAYTDYQRFVTDFALANLQISSVEAAQVFVAACASSPIHSTLGSDDCESVLPSPRSLLPGHSKDVDDNFDILSCSSSSSTAPAMVASAFLKLTQSAEGVVLYLSPAAQVGRLCMSFSAFLDALGRLGLVAFAKTKAGKLHALQSVKAVFHHLSRGLTRSRVLDIVANHGSASIHSGRFYSGSVAFNNKFLDMWRYEGSPDYLAVGAGASGGEAGGVDLATTTMNREVATVTSPVAGRKATTAPNLPLSPSKRLTSSAALFDERIVTNGAGRGREALDRLVRNAFIRNAVAATAAGTTCSTTTGGSTVGVAVSEDKEDCITPASLPRDATTGTTECASVKPSHPPPASKLSGDAKSTTVEGGMSAQLLSDDAQQPTASDPAIAKQPPLRSYLSGGVPLHPNDERTLFESILLKGGVFKKYGQWGNPHRRFVWCGKEFDGVFWRPINKKHSLSKDGLAVASLVTVLPGNSHRTRYAFMKHLSDEKSLSRCFSLVAEDRRLDLEADSEASRDLWMQALQFLIRNQRPRVAAT